MNVRERMRELGGEEGVRFYEEGRRLQQEISDKFTEIFEDAVRNKGSNSDQVLAAWLSALAEEYAAATVVHFEHTIEPMGGDTSISVQASLNCFVGYLNKKMADLATRRAGVEDKIKAAAKRGAEA